MSHIFCFVYIPVCMQGLDVQRSLPNCLTGTLSHGPGMLLKTLLWYTRIPLLLWEACWLLTDAIDLLLALWSGWECLGEGRRFMVCASVWEASSVPNVGASSSFPRGSINIKIQQAIAAPITQPTMNKPERLRNLRK